MNNESNVSFNQTEISSEQNIIQFNNLISHISKIIENIVIEIQYPSTNFNKNYQLVESLKEKYTKIIKIRIFIKGIDNTDQQFHNDKNIDYVKLDDSVHCILNQGLDGSFEGCSSLTQISIPSSVTSIESYSFYGCSSLTQISIPSSVTSIEFSAFKGCSSLAKISIPSSVTKIDGSAFNYCNQIDKITIIPCSEKRIEYFEDKLLVYKSDIANENYDTFIWAKQTINTIIIPQFIKIIESSSFEGCSSLTQISIPSSVNSIRNNTFKGCSSLTQITIPSSVTSIGDSSFEGCSSLTQIKFELPSSVTSIGFSAFYGCSSLTQITIPSSVTLIRSYAFDGCSSLTQILIPSSITKIESNAFPETIQVIRA